MGTISDGIIRRRRSQNRGSIAQGIIRRRGLPQNTSFNAVFQDSDETLYDSDLRNDVNFQKASEVIYNMNKSVDAERLESPEDYAKYGIETMGWFNWNLGKMTLDANRISGATEEQKKAFLYMMEAYDELGLSWNGTKRLFKGILLDPTTYVGLTTFGIGLAGKEATKQVGKESFKELLKTSTRAGVIASVESGVYTSVDDINRQVVETSVSGEGINLGRVAKSAAIGATVGFGLGTGIAAAYKKVTNIRNKNTKEIAKEVNEQEIADKLPTIDEGRPKQTAQETPIDLIRRDFDSVIQAIKRTVPTGKTASLRPDGTQDLDDLVQSVQPVKKLLIRAAGAVDGVRTRNPEDLATYFEQIAKTDGEAQYLEVATTQAVSALKVKVYNLRLKQKQLNGDEADDIGKQIDTIESVIAPLDEVDKAMSTVTGRRLRSRQASLNTGKLRGETITGLEAKGMTRVEAERHWEAIIEEKLMKKEFRNLSLDFDNKIEEARKSGDIESFLKLKHEKKIKVDELKEQTLKEEGSSIYRAINKPVKLLNEVMISFVFSPATIIVNLVPSLVKTLYKPLLNNLVQEGLSATSRKKIAAEYSSMTSMIPSAAKMAKAAWRYEKSILTGDSARFLEDYTVIPKKFGGGVLRFFPRALLATDAFFESIHYRAYTVGNATGKAMEDGVAKGLKGKKLDAFVKNETQKSLDKAYAPEENAIEILMQEGISRGKSGKELEDFINQELLNNTDVFTKATDQDGRDYVQDILFKRDFSGKSTISELAKGYEGFVNRNPVMRIMGQLFFRTPVRVFEEGIRLTPGVNLISPSFIKDLRGINGPIRQARANGEALLSYSIGGSILSMYATGNVTGAMGQDYKQTRQGVNAGGQEPYTIKFSDGSTFNYRNFDPFSTPIKIIVNALERAETLAYRAEQGEALDKTAMDKVQASVSIAIGSIAQSIRDANLASGVDAVADFWADLQDEEGSDQLIKFVGKKVQLFLPNTYYKYQLQDNPFLSDPVTLEQFWRQRINPADPLVPKRYTALGRPVTLANPPAVMYYFNTATVEERKRGKPQKELEVEQFLYELAQVGDTHFTAPYKYKKYMGDIDLRTQVTKDGKESYYDRWMRYPFESGLIEVLYNLKSLPMGTASNPGIAEIEARKTINSFRKNAFLKLLSEETFIQKKYQSLLLNKLLDTSGQRSIENIPQNITGTR